MIAYDVQDVTDILQMIPHDYPLAIGIKLPAYLMPMHMRSVVQVICKYPQVAFITLINTIANAVMKPSSVDGVDQNWTGGLGGKPLKHIALGNICMLVRFLREYDRQDIDIIGVGGVFHGQDVREMLMCGAKAVQIGTCHLLEGPSCFARIEKEFLHSEHQVHQNCCFRPAHL